MVDRDSFGKLLKTEEWVKPFSSGGEKGIFSETEECVCGGVSKGRFDSLV